MSAEARLLSVTPLLDGRTRAGSAAWPWARILDNEANIPEILADLKRQGYVELKVYDDLTKDVHAKICQIATDLNLRVAGHVPLDLTWNDAIRNGQRGFDHLGGLLPGPQGKLDLRRVEETALELAAAKADVCPTLLATCKSSPWVTMHDAGLVLNILSEAGVLLRMGTDYPVPGISPTDAYWAEVEQWENSGVYGATLLASCQRLSGSDIKQLGGEPHDYVFFQENPIKSLGDNHISFIVRAANSSIVPIEEGGRSGEREGNVKSCLSGVLSRQVVKAKQPGGHARGVLELCVPEDETLSTDNSIWSISEYAEVGNSWRRATCQVGGLGLIRANFEVSWMGTLSKAFYIREGDAWIYELWRPTGKCESYNGSGFVRPDPWISLYASALCGYLGGQETWISLSEMTPVIKTLTRRVTVSNIPTVIATLLTGDIPSVDIWIGVGNRLVLRSAQWPTGPTIIRVTK